MSPDESGGRALRIARGFAKGAIAAVLIMPLVGHIATYGTPAYFAVLGVLAIGVYLFARRWNRLGVGNAV